VRLGDVAEVRRGFTTECNEFFYLPNKHFDIKKDGKYYELIPKHEGLPRGIRIEEEFLKPVIISPRDSKYVSIKKKALKRLALLCNQERKLLNKKSVLKYIAWGEKQNFHKRQTCSTRNKWWNLGDRTFGEVLWPMVHNDRHTVFISNKEIVVDHNLFEILTDKKERIWISLISSYQVIIRELFGRVNLGEGALKTEGIDIKRFLVIQPDIFTSEQISKIHSLIERFNSREIQSIFQELGINPNFPIREQTPNPLPDRKALDDIVFDILGLTEEVYWAVCELVKSRLEKVGSV
jgi:hypothetical protein